MFSIFCSSFPSLQFPNLKMLLFDAFLELVWIIDKGYQLKKKRESQYLFIPVNVNIHVYKYTFYEIFISNSDVSIIKYFNFLPSFTHDLSSFIVPLNAGQTNHFELLLLERCRKLTQTSSVSSSYSTNCPGYQSRGNATAIQSST